MTSCKLEFVDTLVDTVITEHFHISFIKELCTYVTGAFTADVISGNSP